MSVRQIRRTFAAPFIVTLGTAAACGPKPLPKHDHVNPPGPHSNPPAPDTQPATPDPTPAPVTDKPIVKNDNPPPPEPPAPVREPAKFEQHWTVMKFKGKDECSAMVDVQCPKPEKGKPVATCNPPPPIKYACPDNFKEGDTLKIVLRAGATDCFVDRPTASCPKGALCNPPPPRKVACPER